MSNSDDALMRDHDIVDFNGDKTGQSIPTGSSDVVSAAQPVRENAIPVKIKNETVDLDPGVIENSRFKHSRLYQLVSGECELPEDLEPEVGATFPISDRVRAGFSPTGGSSRG